MRWEVDIVDGKTGPSFFGKKPGTELGHKCRQLRGIETLCSLLLGQGAGL